MTRHVKFSQNEELKLPSILVNNRIARGSDVVGRSANKQDTFPHWKENGHVVSGDPLPHQQPHLTYYHNEAGSRVRAEHPPRQYKRRLQSLPSRKPRAADDESPRQANSAPSKKGYNAVAPLPKLNNLMAKLKSSEREQTYGRHWTSDPAGVSTKGHDAQNKRSHKFATSWANARAEQANLRSNNKSSADEKPSNTESKRQEHPKPDARKTQDAEVTQSNAKEKEQTRRKTEQVLSHMFLSADNKENTSPGPHDDSFRKKNESPYLGIKMRGQRERRSVKPRSEWNPSYVVEKPIPVSPRRQEAELTHHPSITDTDEVYKAYTGVSKRELRRCDDNISRVFSQCADVYQATLTVSPRNKKEYVLTLREADTYKKISSVYGKDGIRKKRKSLLLQKLVTVELDQIKQHNQVLREKERKRAESKRRQQKQLNYIRKRFKEQQSRRFRSQYVTSKVLEHEKMNRKDYGLPEEEFEEEENEEEEEEEEHTAENEINSEKSADKKHQPITNFDKKKKKKAYEKKYKNLFDFNMGPAWDPRPTTPKMEGVDIVTVEVKDKEGKVKIKKAEVKDIMKEAKNMLKTSKKDLLISDDDSREATPRGKSDQTRRRKPSLDSLDFEDDDDDDIFERARRKYNLDVESNN